VSKYKSGLDYFSFDIDFFNDEKIEFTSAKFGTQGEIITIKLLCKIYRNGYYLKWGEDECLLFSKRVGEGITTELIDNVIKELLKREFFDKQIFKEYQVLTSRGIQKRYLEAIKRRKEVIIYKEYFLLNEHNADIIPSNVNIISLNVDISKQSKVKESKEEKSKVEKKDIKESVDSSFKKPKKEGKDPLEFSFKDKCWWGLYDWRLKMYQGAFPMLTVNYLFNDLWKTKFLSDPEKYKKMIKEEYGGKIKSLVYAWLQQAKKFYIKDHPDYEEKGDR
jgi:hypothetical protein